MIVLKKRGHKIFALVAFLSLIFSFSWGLYGRLAGKHPLEKEGFKKTAIEIKGKKLEVFVADEPYLLRKGLSGTEQLEPNQGMLFLHFQPGRYEYVMREMKFNLDFVFIRDDRIVDLAKNVPFDFGGRIRGAEDYDKVLEITAGWIEENGIEIGDEVEFNAS